MDLPDRISLAGDAAGISAVGSAEGVHSGHWIVPGFVDIHVHGGGGHTFTTGDPDSARGAAAFHLAHGTTTLLASLVSSPFEVMLQATRAYAPLVEQGVLAGIHLEIQKAAPQHASLPENQKGQSEHRAQQRPLTTTRSRRAHPGCRLL